MLPGHSVTGRHFFVFLSEIWVPDLLHFSPKCPPNLSSRWGLGCEPGDVLSRCLPAADWVFCGQLVLLTGTSELVFVLSALDDTRGGINTRLVFCSLHTGNV